MHDCGIVIQVRELDGLAIIQCRKRDRVFANVKWKNAELKVNDILKFRVDWNP